MLDFKYSRAKSLADAASSIKAAPDGKLLAGGQTLIPTLKQRLAKPSMLIDLRRIDDLKGVHQAGTAFGIGAMTTHQQIAASAELRAAIPALCHLAAVHRRPVERTETAPDPALQIPRPPIPLTRCPSTSQRHRVDVNSPRFTTPYYKGTSTTSAQYEVSSPDLCKRDGFSDAMVCVSMRPSELKPSRARSACSSRMS